MSLIVKVNSITKTFKMPTRARHRNRIGLSHTQRGKLDVTILKDVSLDIHRGELIALRGSSGAGKTLLMKLIAGVTPPTHGSIEHHGSVTRVIDPTALFLSDYTLEENIRMNAAVLGVHSTNFNVREIHDQASSTEYEQVPLGYWPTNLKRRVIALCGLRTRHDLMLHDMGLFKQDEEFRDFFWNRLTAHTIANRSMLVSMTEKDILHQQCDRSFAIENGHLLESSPAPAATVAP